jgi:adenylate cyclase class 2
LIIATHHETEIKLRVHSPKYAATLLASRGFAVSKPRHFEVNLVFDTAANQLRETGRLLRLRDADGKSTVTYKGVEVSGRHKVREEVEVGVEDFAAARHIFERLGFLPKFRYEKYRTEYARLGDPGLVVLDETPIGAFLEIEGPPEWIDATARALGFDEGQFVTASYGRLYSDWCAERGIPPSDMVFRDAEPS